VSVGIDFDLIW